MSRDQSLCEPRGSTLNPTTFTFRFSNSDFRRATSPSSVVHHGVKSLGCEKRTAQPLPIHSWKLILPCVVSAVKLGASLLILSVMGSPPPAILTPTPPRREAGSEADVSRLSKFSTDPVTSV